MPKVSVVIPIHNVEQYLSACLSSVINQTLEDIEIICVNDASTDHCAEIIQEFSPKDSRVKVITFKDNLGTSQARKAGVLASKGDYVMFLDGDDEYCPDACETAYNSITKLKTDIVQFDTEVINLGGFPEQKIRILKELLRPYYEKTIKDADIVKKVWEDKTFGFTLWNKIYNGNICRESFAEISDGSYPKAQDLYAFFIIAHHSKSYAGIPEALYKYRFGSGVTGSDIMPFSKYEILLKEKKVSDALSDYVTRKSLDDYKEIIETIRNNFINECISKWANNLSSSDQSEGFSKLIEVWGRDSIINRMAVTYWDSYPSIGKKLRHVDCLRHSSKRKKKQITVAAVYPHITNGGAERVTAELCNLWASATDSEGSPLFKVILITDEEPSPNEYPINNNIQREFLPSFYNSEKEKYSDRYNAWNKILDDNSIDVIISGRWYDSCTFWDMMTVKTHHSNPAFTIHSHTFCAVPYGFSGSTGCIRHLETYMLSDGIVTLSEADKEYAEAFSNNVSYINNPITYDPKSARTSVYKPNTLLWVGRISPEKNPLDSIRMMSVLVTKVPDAKLYIVGTGNDKLLAEMSALIEKLGLTDNVEMVGFVLEPSKYYSEASVYVSTSKVEGFSLTMCEAKTYAIPIVTYDFPWLTFIQDGRGILTAEQGCYDKLAEAAAYLLKNPAEARKLGSAGKKQLIEMYQRNDLVAEWQDFFYKAIKGSEPFGRKRKESNKNILLRYITSFQYEGRKNRESQLTRQVNDLKRIVKNSERPFLSNFTAYVELKSCGTGNSLTILNNGYEKVYRAPWYDDKSGLGYRVQSESLAADIDIICHGSGDLNVFCRGADVRDPNDKNKRIPVWVTFTSLLIDDEQYISQPVAIWHDAPYRCSYTVQDNQKVHIHAEWLPKNHSAAKLLSSSPKLLSFNNELLPLVSVIVPVYNTSGEFLKQSLDCLLNQTLKNIEIICVDNASTDDSADILKEYASKDSRVIVVTLAKNDGAGKARNIGIEKARGKYLYFFEAKDLCETSLLQDTVSLLQKSGGDLAVFNLTRFYPGGTSHVTGYRCPVSCQKNGIWSWKDCPDRILTTVYPVPWNKVIRASLIRKNNIKFDELVSFNEVTFSALVVAQAERIVCLKKELFHYRVIRESLDESVNKLPNVILSLNSLLAQGKQQPNFKSVEKSIMSFAIQQYVSAFKSAAKKWGYEQTLEDYYSEIHQIFNDTEYSALNESDLNDRNLWHEFCAVRQNDLERMNKLLSTEIIVSLTSYPARIKTVHLTVKSLLNQTVPADRIILWLSKSQFPKGEAELPEELRKLVRDSKLQLEWCNEDLKPHKKYFYAMQRYSEAVIITVDDDMLYNKALIEKLKLCWFNFPQCICAMRAHLIASNSSEVLSYSKWLNEVVNFEYKPGVEFCATGVGGILYPPRIFKSDLFDTDAIIDSCLYADDLWLKTFELLDGIPVVIASPTPLLEYIPDTQDTALYNKNKTANDEQLSNIRKIILTKYNKDVWGKDYIDLLKADPNYPEMLFDISEQRLRRLRADCNNKLKESNNTVAEYRTKLKASSNAVAEYQTKLNESNKTVNTYKTKLRRLTLASSARLELIWNNKNATVSVKNRNFNNEVLINYPKWLKHENSNGLIVDSSDFVIDLDLKCSDDCELLIKLKSPDIRSKEDANKSVPMWVTYQSLTVNNEEVLSKPVNAWHNKPYKYVMKLVQGLNYHIFVSWE